MILFILFQGKGPETISMDTSKMPNNYYAIYYINDYRDVLVSWATSNAVVRILEPNGGKIIRLDLNEKTGEKYFIVGCFDSSGFASFKKPSGNPYTSKDPMKLSKAEINQICG